MNTGFNPINRISFGDRFIIRTKNPEPSKVAKKIESQTKPEYPVRARELYPERTLSTTVQRKNGNEIDSITYRIGVATGEDAISIDIIEKTSPEDPKTAMEDLFSDAQGIRYFRPNI